MPKLYSSCAASAPSRQTERGNAAIYVMIVVALFAALSFILARQTDTGEQGALSKEEITVRATQIVQVSNQIKQGIDQMLWSGTVINDLDFTKSGEAGFGTGAIYQVYHPEGGGLVMPRLPQGAAAQVDTDPVAGWYMGMFNNVEWTQSTAQDVILIAHQISLDICTAINEMISGSTTVPALTGEINTILIDDAEHTNGPNADFDSTVCPACDGYPALCVQNNAGTMYSYYNIVAQQ